MSNMRKKAKKKAEKDQNRGGNYNLAIPEGTKTWAPKSKGPFRLDVIPYQVSVGNHPEVKKGELWYQRTYYVHFGLGDDGKQSGICPKTIGKPCPVCEMYKELVSSDDEDDREAAKKIKPKERELYNVIDLDDQDSGVQIFEYSFHLFGKGLSEEINEASEEEAGFAELENGKTLKVHFKKESIGGGTPFWQLRRVDFVDREDYEEDILDEVHDLDSLLKVPSYKELQSLLSGTDEEEEGEEQSSEEEEEEEKPAKKGKKSSKKRKSEDEDEGEKPAKKGKKSSKKKKDEDEGDDEDEDKGKKKSSSKPGKAASKPGKKKKNKCPGGGTFGEDTDELDECNNCDIWTECQEAYDEKYGEDEDD